MYAGLMGPVQGVSFLLVFLGRYGMEKEAGLIPEGSKPDPLER